MIRAVIFDVYGTLMEVGPAPSNADAIWRELWLASVGVEPRLTRLAFSIACSRIIQREHDLAKHRGITRPEINWPSVVVEVLPEVARMTATEQARFVAQQIQTGHTTHVTNECAATLRALQKRGCLLGIASNAQAYTLGELTKALSIHGLKMKMFQPDLCFWSFQHGFSKPDPHVFQILTTRLGARGVPPRQVLMVGDRQDNDMEPARFFGWQTWHLGANGDGSWTAMLQRLFPTLD